ncbi:MAG: SRPBCC family protein [Acidimicrobiia bacterium]
MRRASSGRFDLPLPAADAICLFTPEGERAWSPGWSPQYGTGEPSETPGTVFTTAAHGTETIWVIVEISRSRSSATYARVTPGRHAGTVSVLCVDTRPGHSTVNVSYDMTLIGDRDSSGLDAYTPSQFEEMMRHWSEAIESYLYDQTG